MTSVDPGLASDGRVADAGVDPQFLDRWSPRAYSSRPVASSTLASLFEAARWSPSSGNLQPWVFLYSSTPEEHTTFLSLLDDGNRPWAYRAPVLAFTLARLHSKSGRRNRHAQFDSGASWMALALQARHLDLYAHSMGGFDLERAYEVLRVPPDRFEIMAAMAIGYYGDPSGLSERDQAREKPSGRRPVSAFAFPGALPSDAP